MADPLSAGAGVAGLVSLAIQLAQTSYQYVASVKGSSKVWSSYLRELSSLTSAIIQLDQASQVQGVGHLLIARAPNISDAIIEECRRELELLRLKLSKGGIRGKLEALKWPFTELETRTKVDMLHRFNAIFSSALLVDNFTVSAANYREIRAMREGDDKNELLDWFQPRSDPQSIGAISEQLCTGTGTYFLQNNLYLSWRDRAESILWAYGQPGAGKTMLSAAILEDLGNSFPDSSVIAYHFFRSERRQEPLQDVLRHIVVQALTQLPNELQQAVDLRQKKKKASTELLPKDLVDILVAIAKISTSTYIVLDGLDEYMYLNKLVRVLRTLSAAGVKLLATSRDLPDIRKHFDGSPSLEVRASKHDIDHYVNWRLQEDAEVCYELLTTDLKSEIAVKIGHHINGSFLLARLLMDHINSLTTIKKIRNSLASLPSDYQKAYQNTLDRILEQGIGRRELALKTFTWICNAKRPFKMDELQNALVIEDGVETVSPEDLESSRTIISACLGLVVMSKTDQTVDLIHSTVRSFLQENQSLMDPETHLTISKACLTYMSFPELANGPCNSLEALKQRLSGLPFLDYSARFYGYHVKEVELACLTQLLELLKNEKQRESSWQILHFMAEPDSELAGEVIASMPNRASVLHVAAYWGFSNLLALYTDNGSVLSKESDQVSINKLDSHSWTPLHWAASNGHSDLVKNLLDAGAAIDSVDLSQWTPLFWAAIKGHETVVANLLQRGANCFHADTDGMTALHWAMSAGQDEISQLLIKQGDLIPATTPRTKLGLLLRPKTLSVAEAKSIIASYDTFKSLFNHSAEGSDVQTFLTLLRSKERVEESSHNFLGTIHFSQDKGNGYFAAEPLLKNLWRAINKRDRFFWNGEAKKTPLMAFRKKILEHAIREEQLSVVGVLLELGPDLSQDFDNDHISYAGDRYLHVAASCRNPEIVMALMAKHVNVNVRNKHGMTPLHFACRKGSSEGVKALLSNDEIDINATDENGHTPLMMLFHDCVWRTATDPQEALDICKAFVSKGLSLSTRDKDDNTFLHMAVQVWNPAVIQLVVDSGCDMNAKNKYGEIPLHRLAASRTKQHYLIEDRPEGMTLIIPKKLIDATVDMVLHLTDPANVNLVCSSNSWEGRQEDTPLSLAIDSESWTLARRLYALQAAFHTTRNLSSMLYDVAQAGILEFVRFIMQHGADVNEIVHRKSPNTILLRLVEWVPILLFNCREGFT